MGPARSALRSFGLLPHIPVWDWYWLAGRVITPLTMSGPGGIDNEVPEKPVHERKRVHLSFKGWSITLLVEGKRVLSATGDLPPRILATIKTIAQVYVLGDGRINEDGLLNQLGKDFASLEEKKV